MKLSVQVWVARVQLHKDFPDSQEYLWPLMFANLGQKSTLYPLKATSTCY